MTGWALRIGIDTRDEATVVTPAGMLSVQTAPQLREVLLKCFADQPVAVIVDLAALQVQTAYSLSIFGVVARRTSQWSGSPLILVPRPSAKGRLNLSNKALARFVLVVPTLQAALAAARQPPVRQLSMFTLPPQPVAARSARRGVEQTCERWDCTDLTEDAVAIAGELVDNAIRYAESDLTMRLELRRGLLTVAVTDDNPASPAPQSPHPADDPRTHGYGLAIVAALARSWGTTATTAGGKTVWAVLRSTKSPATPAETPRKDAPPEGPLDRAELEALLGEPLMVDDPLITVAQAAAILGMRVDRVRDLITTGGLDTEGSLSSGRRRIRLSDVLRLAAEPAQRISVTAAAHLLGESGSTVRRLVRAELLTWHGGRWPLSRPQVDQLADQRRGWLTVVQATTATRLGAEDLRQLLDDGVLSSTGDARRPIERAQLVALGLL